MVEIVYTAFIFLITSLLPLSSPFTLVDPEYNKNVRPREGERPDEVKIGLFINSIRTVSEVDMVAVLDVFVQAEWYDERLNKTWLDLFRVTRGYNYNDCSGAKCNTRITMGSNFADQIWKPDFYFKTAVSIIPADDNNDNVGVFFHRDGKIFYSSRYIITNSCPMELTHFPFDSYSCKIRVGSYKYQNEFLQLLYEPALSGMYRGQTTANFQFSDFDHTKDYSSVPMTYLGEMYIEHEIRIHMQRKFGIYLLTIYLPNCSLSVLAWVNFWIDPKSTPERAGLTITLALAQIVLITGVEQNFPSVSDFKMVDVYLIVNFLFNLACLVETVLASRMTSKKRLCARSVNEPEKATHDNAETMMDLNVYHVRREQKQSSGVENCNLVSNAKLDPKVQTNETKAAGETSEDPTNPIDFWSRVGFPIAFGVWNILFLALTLHFTN